MSPFLLEPGNTKPAICPLGRRHPHDTDEDLILDELNPATVVDHLDGNAAPVELTTFGMVRETCPKCRRAHLRLVLRQTAVRTAHLFCDSCASCFDAHYRDGAPALTV